ncbi:MAG: DUF6491 family protein [Pseudomonadota bacterium]
MMRLTVLATLFALVAACAGGPREEDPEIVAIQDFIAVSELEPADRIRTDNNNNYGILNAKYIIFESRRDMYLVEFQRNCWELFDSQVIAYDERRDARYMRPRVDTIRGCLIGRAFEINEGQKAELEAMGDAPGGVR